MQSPHTPRVIDIGEDACLVECPQCREGAAWMSLSESEFRCATGSPQSFLPGTTGEHRSFVLAADAGEFGVPVA